MTLPATPAFFTPTITIPAPQRRLVHLSDIEDSDSHGAVNETRTSIEHLGITQAVILEEGQPHTILDGKRRIINARHVGIPEVLADLYPPLTKEQRAHLKLSLHRRAPNRVDETRSLLDLASLHHIPLSDPDAAEQLARISGLKTGQVRKYLKLMRLPADILSLIGTTISEGVALNAANLSGPHLQTAIHQIRSAAAQDNERFTGQDLKDIQLARAADMSTHLSATALPALVQLSPVQALASEVRLMASERHIPLADLIAELGLAAAPVVNPWATLLGHITPTPDAHPAPAPVPADPAPWLQTAASAAPWTAAPPVITPTPAAQTAQVPGEVTAPSVTDIFGPFPSVDDIFTPAAQTAQAAQVPADVLPGEVTAPSVADIFGPFPSVADLFEPPTPADQTAQVPVDVPPAEVTAPSVAAPSVATAAPAPVVTEVASGLNLDALFGAAAEEEPAGETASPPAPVPTPVPAPAPVPTPVAALTPVTVPTPEPTVSPLASGAPRPFMPTPRAHAPHGRTRTSR